MYQKVIIMGNLGRDPEMRYTPQGTPVTNFSVATSYKWTGADGTPNEETTWFRVSAWGRMAEVCNEYLSKGRQVFVEGRLRPDPETRELTLAKVHPGASVEQAREATGWDLKTAEDLGATDPPSEEELRVLRHLRAKTEAANKGMQVLRNLQARIGAAREDGRK